MLPSVVFSYFTMKEKKAHKKGKGALLRRSRNKYRLILQHGETFEERFAIRVSGLHVVILLLFSAILISIGTFFLISHTSLREVVPGYTKSSYRQDMYRLLKKADSLEKAMRVKDTYLRNIRIILSDSSLIETVYAGDSVNTEEDSLRSRYSHISTYRFYEDSLLLLMYGDTSHTVSAQQEDSLFNTIVHEFNDRFHPPVEGVVAHSFNPQEAYFGITIVTPEYDSVFAISPGTVIFSQQTGKKSYTVAIQHDHDLVTIYRHNTTLLKRVGDYVSIGEAVATLEKTEGKAASAHFLFEVWYRGIPVNPIHFLSK
ncbi:MAG: hypothetical protein CSA95_03960 [Bacteroidetes bacterium]|nr:MAG: hypothetical protein CSA95_03960 [Bacteroidota bacterium]PIE87691.1 MAG: hypothetical protein CSA04_05665 [Bacteroidota bacterium]